jgi:diadenosine tetraphosphate (Ap4A) HIT family hydrolase
MFVLDHRLREDTSLIGDLPLSRVLLHRDANYPWCVLVPRREDKREIFELKERDQVTLLEESRAVAAAMTTLFQPDKLNIAALGNVVSQLHVHHIARFKDDPAWPAPVWGARAAKVYGPGKREARIEQLRLALKIHGLSW